MCLSSPAILPCQRTTSQRGRQFSLRCLRQALSGHAVAFDMIDECLLVVSELVTNAVTAGRTVVSITVEIHREHVRVAAYDDGPGLPRPVAAAADDRHGRGLALVDSLSRAWGGQRQSHGKQAWADVAIPSGLEVAGECRV